MSIFLYKYLLLIFFFFLHHQKYPRKRTVYFKHFFSIFILVQCFEKTANISGIFLEFPLALLARKYDADIIGVSNISAEGGPVLRNPWDVDSLLAATVGL